MSELTITFQDFAEATSVRPSVSRLAFSIEPPIAVYDKNMINTVAESNAPLVTRGYNLGVPVAEIALTHSDVDATYGHYITNDHRIASTPSEGNEELRQFLRSSFECALNPMGNVAVNYIFLSDQS